MRLPQDKEEHDPINPETSSCLLRHNGFIEEHFTINHTNNNNSCYNKCNETYENKQINNRQYDQLKKGQFRWFRARTRISYFKTLMDYKTNFLSSKIVFTLFFTYLSILVPQTQSSDYINNNLNINKNSGQCKFELEMFDKLFL